MKRFLALTALLFASLFARAQVDINITQIGPVIDIARNVTWAGVGVGTISNNYILSPQPGATGACLYIQNNDSSGHAFTIGMQGTGDQSLVKYTGNTAAWGSSIPFTFAPALGSAVLANATTPVAITLSGAAKYVISISGTSGSSTANMFLVYGTALTPCVGIPPNVVTAGNVTSLVQCDKTATTTAAVGATSVLVNAISGQSVYICGFISSVSAAITTPGVIQIETGTAANCSGSTAVLYAFDLAASVGSIISMGAGSGTLMHGIPTGQICLVNNGVTAGTVRATVSYTQF